jgi:hypothetical protein
MSAPSEVPTAPEGVPVASEVPANPAQDSSIEAEVSTLPESNFTVSRLTLTSKADDYNDGDSAIAVSTIRKQTRLVYLVCRILR